MLEIIERHPELAVWIVLIVAVALCYIVRVGSSQWRAVRQAELEGILKEQMVQRGMSGQEIARVIEAGQPLVELEEIPSAARPSGHRAWLWLAIGVPVAMFVLCSGMMMAMASVTVSCDDPVQMLVDDGTLENRR